MVSKHPRGPVRMNRAPALPMARKTASPIQTSWRHTPKKGSPFQTSKKHFPETGVLSQTTRNEVYKQELVSRHLEGSSGKSEVVKRRLGKTSRKKEAPPRRLESAPEKQEQASARAEIAPKNREWVLWHFYERTRFVRRNHMIVTGVMDIRNIIQMGSMHLKKKIRSTKNEHSGRDPKTVSSSVGFRSNALGMRPML